VDDVIPPAVREFITRHIDTVSELEALLILRAHPKESWTLDQLANRVYVSRRGISEIIERFAAEGFVKREDDRYRYDCKDATLEETIAELAQRYASHLIPVTNMIHSKPRSIRSFSDAFKLRKDK
jgi:DNA-binding MarR family transcriptional regulator